VLVVTVDESGSTVVPPDDDLQQRLARLEAVSDLTLSRLDVEDLLPELLERVRDLLGTDTSAVLLADETRKFLVATAACGLEEEVRQGSRVPIGQGFAGRVAAERRPVTIEVSPKTVVNPVLTMKGIKSMLGVPLLAGDDVLGVLHVGTLRPHEFTAADIDLLEQAADRAALAIQASRARADESAALSLQRAFSPQQLPSPAGLDLAARYVPGSRSGVGGDWYDVFPLPHGMIGITMGDVMGHGLKAAAVMGRLRGGLRAYALEDDDPGRVLQRLDRMFQHFEPGQTATVLYAMLDPRTGEVWASSAGHLPPALALRGQDATMVAVPADVMLGVLHDLRRRTTQFTVPQGALLCLFTDGLVERRRSDLDKSLDLLRRALSAETPSAEAACADVMAALVGDVNVEDDVALLILKRDTSPAGVTAL
jgi:serine phosphatase RsbU (regulator of sigma subunit)